MRSQPPVSAGRRRPLTPAHQVEIPEGALRVAQVGECLPSGAQRIKCGAVNGKDAGENGDGGMLLASVPQGPRQFGLDRGVVGNPSDRGVQVLNCLRLLSGGPSGPQTAARPAARPAASSGLQDNIKICY